LKSELTDLVGEKVENETGCGEMLTAPAATGSRTGRTGPKQQNSPEKKP
jgi:hypothetical protein